MKKLLIILLVLSASCKVVDITGSHKVQYVKKFNKKHVVKFYDLKREFIFNADTLKRGDVVRLRYRGKE